MIYIVVYIMLYDVLRSKWKGNTTAVELWAQTRKKHSNSSRVLVFRRVKEWMATLNGELS